MTDYRCVECGEKATHMTSINGQGQTFYCSPHAAAPELGRKDEYAVRNPRQGKAHRYGYKPSWQTFRLLVCGANDHDMTERVPLAQTAPEDRCSRCYPPDSTAAQPDAEADS